MDVLEGPTCAMCLVTCFALSWKAVFLADFFLDFCDDAICLCDGKSLTIIRHQNFFMNRTGHCTKFYLDINCRSCNACRSHSCVCWHFSPHLYTGLQLFARCVVAIDKVCWDICITKLYFLRAPSIWSANISSLFAMKISQSSDYCISLRASSSRYPSNRTLCKIE